MSNATDRANPRPPESVKEVTTAYLTPLLIELLDDSGLDVADVSVRRLRQGTSGSQMYRIAVQARNRSATIRLLLKVDKAGEINETRFYQELARRVPIDTARALDARVLRDGRGWILMEELQGATPGEHWTRQDVRSVIRDMAELHAAHWGDAAFAQEFAWLPHLDAGAIDDQLAMLRSCVSAIRAAGLAGVLPQVLSLRRLELIDRVLDRAQTVLDPLLAAGQTLVHGDYWFHNVQLLTDGRRVLLDWQTCRWFSGIWELVYFLDLWHVVGKRSFRVQIPEAEEQAIEWYAEALREQGVDLRIDDFREAVTCAYIWHPLTHWLTRYGRIAEKAANMSAWRMARNVPVIARTAATALASTGALRHMASVWEQWEGRVEARFDT